MSYNNRKPIEYVQSYILVRLVPRRNSCKCLPLCHNWILYFHLDEDYLLCYVLIMHASLDYFINEDLGFSLFFLPCLMFIRIITKKKIKSSFFILLLCCITIPFYVGGMIDYSNFSYIYVTFVVICRCIIILRNIISQQSKYLITLHSLLLLDRSLEVQFEKLNG